ncbi:BON domain-containing protein [Rhizobium sp. NTR19]|uniref:BON domain-containing protein n=1 Tax=Neorhizobium turbinariae TaxID=2937795 RepID=A0ABT0IM09_9HYPH|nr:BON domain-containing protein [Neorhizobium turbinariae]MCK8778869.1 BON domain-containing protein [Neorhizobium turbinariae]
MANGPYSQSGGYRHDRMRDERDHSRDESFRDRDRGSSGGYRPGDTGYGSGYSAGDRDDDVFGGRDTDDRSRSSRYGRGEHWADNDFGHERGYGDTGQSRIWARDAYRGRPTSFSYDPRSDRVNQVENQYYGSDYEHRQDRDYRYEPNARSRSQGDDQRGRSFMQRAGDEVASWFGDEDAERRRDMDAHRGKGPKGYQRSDARIEEDVNDRLSDDPMLDASNISVTVSQAEVTLDGFVSSRADKRRAEDLVDNISGVRHVQNNLRVGDGQAGTDSGAPAI